MAWLLCVWRLMWAIQPVVAIQPSWQIEKAFNVTKAWLKRHRDWVDLPTTCAFMAVHQALSSISRDDCMGFVHSCRIYSWDAPPPTAQQRRRQQRQRMLAVLAALLLWDD